MPNIIRFGGYSESVPSIFGTGADGDLTVTGTTTLPVTVPHQSIVEKQYKSLTINAGAILKCASWNAGLILRVKGDCTIHGTIDQSGMAPKTNPQNNYSYPSQLICGDGGDGGRGRSEYTYPGDAGIGMLKRPYGGGYSGGGSGGGGEGVDGDTNREHGGGNGGDSTGSTIDISNIFVGGPGKVSASGKDGSYGGGGGGDTGNGGSGAGAYGASYGGGGAGNYGGGVVLLYVGGNLLVDGQILCNGLKGGDGAYGKNNTSGQVDYGSGGGAGGGGGGAIYILHRGSYTNTGLMQVNGGAAGVGGYDPGTEADAGSGIAGGIGSITVIQGDK